jgi:hypothetical protein
MAIVYILTSFLLGLGFMRLLSPSLFVEEGFYEESLFPRIFVVLPGAFVSGTIFSGWIAYILASVFRDSGKNMIIGCAVSSVLSLVFFVLVFWRKKLKKEIKFLGLDLLRFLERHPWMVLIFGAFFWISVWLMNATFFMEDGKIKMADSTWGDFVVHTAISRSFSLGVNFPTQYPHFPDGTMRYHFMYQFVAGLLESAGMGIVAAYNTLSVIFFFSVFLLIFALTVLLSKKVLAGLFADLFFLSRPSLNGLFRILKIKDFTLSEFLLATVKTEEYTGVTTNETWGYWNLNTYINQRHLSLGVCLILTVVIILLPLVNNFWTEKSRPDGLLRRALKSVLSKDGWLTESETQSFQAVGIGLLVGAAAYFHGSSVIALLVMLAVLALFSRNRLVFLIIAVISISLSVFQTSYFAPGADVGSPRILPGFIVLDKSFFGVFSYLAPLLMVIAIFCVLGLRSVRLLSIFGLMAISLIILTFTIVFNIEPSQNHKFMIIALIILNIIGAVGAAQMFEKGEDKSLTIALRALGVISLVLSLSGGVIDIFRIKNTSGRGRSYNIKLSSEFSSWIISSTSRDAIFLTSMDATSEVLMAGRKEFFGLRVYSWICGYDVFGRAKIYNQIIGADSGEMMKRLALENEISYIVINKAIKDDNADLNEYVMKETFELAYSELEPPLSVYATGYDKKSDKD